MDVIRASAILLILCSHSTLLLFPDQDTLVLTTIRFFGTIGVDLFFVLSGFLIGRIILNQLEAGRTKFKDFQYFWIRRWFRTLPNYFLVLTLNIILLYLFFGEVANGLVFYFMFLQNFASPQSEFFSESWSLSIEEFAYVIGPLLLYGAVRLVDKVSKHKLFLLVSLIIIISVGLMRYQFHMNHFIDSAETWSKGLRKVVIYRLDSIYYGFVFVYLMKYFNDYFEKNRLKLFVLGIILFFVTHSILFYYGITPVNTPLFFNVFYLPFLSVNLLLFFPFLIKIKANNYVKTRITKLSIISYGIYLLNYSVILLSIQQFKGVYNAPFMMKLTILIGYWGLTIYLSYLLYKYFEKPMTNLRNMVFLERFLYPIKLTNNQFFISFFFKTASRFK